VPYTRGSEYSRPAAQLLDEAKRLVDRGVSEVTLLGQNVNAYSGEGPSGEKWTLARLLSALAEIPGLKRLRYTTSHPNDMSDDLIAAHRDLPSLMPYLHLPFQAGSDRILKAMNRKHTAADYLRIIDRLRADFQETLRIIETVKYAQAYSFKYSARPGTPAADKDGQIDEAVKSERLARLQAILNRQQSEFNASMIGREFEVLWETKGKKDGQLVGRSPYLQAVHADGDTALLGRITRTEIVRSSQNSLQGVIKLEDVTII
jgi:tRNA-2-methylthio-N6-dimethylallyladenosine synthase